MERYGVFASFLAVAVSIGVDADIEGALSSPLATIVAGVAGKEAVLPECSEIREKDYCIAGNFRMVLIFVYFICSIPYTKIITVKV